MARRKTHEEFVEEIYSKFGYMYEIHSEYKGHTRQIEVEHLVCGNYFNTTPNNLLKMSECPLCSTKKKTKRGRSSNWNTETFSDYVSVETREQYVVESEYIKMHDKIVIRHLKCGATYEVTPRNFITGSRCPHCKSSKGETSCVKFLNKLRLYFERQYKFELCVDKRELPFDFAVFSESQLVALIEYDGKQHYEAVEFWGGEANLLATQRRDAIKTQYCADNGIPLIRIPFWDFDNIDAILTEKLLPLLDASSTQKQAS